MKKKKLKKKPVELVMRADFYQGSRYCYFNRCDQRVFILKIQNIQCRTVSNHIQVDPTAKNNNIY